MNCALGCRRHPTTGLLCDPHRDQLADLLDPRQTGQVFAKPGERRTPPSIPVLYGMLTAERGRHGIAAVGPSGFASTSPGDDQVLVLRDPRSRAEVAGPDDTDRAPRPPLVVLRALAARVDRRALDGQQQAGPRQPASVESLSRWLYAAVDWIAQQPWVWDAWTDLRTLSGALRAALGDPPPAPVGTCRAIVDDDGVEVGGQDPRGQWRCAVPLLMPEMPPRAPDEPVQLPTLRCPSCGHTYSGAELIQIGRDQHQSHQEAS